MSQTLNRLSHTWRHIQSFLFPMIWEELGELTAKQKLLVNVLEFARLEEHLPHAGRYPGRPLEDRIAIARAFVTKMVYDMTTTRVLMDRLASDPTLRRLCGWERREDVPSEATFSRAFAEFAESHLPERVHQALVEQHLGDQISSATSPETLRQSMLGKNRRKKRPLRERNQRSEGTRRKEKSAQSPHPTGAADRKPTPF